MQGGVFQEATVQFRFAGHKEKTNAFFLVRYDRLYRLQVVEVKSELMFRCMQCVVVGFEAETHFSCTAI